MHRRSRSRSPIRNQYDSRRRNENSADCRVLCLKPIPMFWFPEKVKSVVQNWCKSKSIMENLKFVLIHQNEDGTNMAMIKFTNSYICNLAIIELKNLEIAGSRVSVSLDLDNMFNKHRNQSRAFNKNPKAKPPGNTNHEQPFQNTMREVEAPHQNQTANSDQTSHRNNDASQESHETYGLSLEFLDSLNIQLPLHNKIFINNLDSLVTESKLREVFGYCGQIVSCSLIMSRDEKKVMGKIEYDHPVEAVQAIAMLNKQELYSKRMIVQMDTSPNSSASLPNGLGRFGLGLGVNGEPLRGVRVHLEVRPLKQMLENITTDLQKHLLAQELTKTTTNNSTQSQINPVLNQTQMPVQPVQNIMGVAQIKPINQLQNIMQNAVMQNALVQNAAMQNTTIQSFMQNTDLGMGVGNVQPLSRWDQTSSQWGVVQNKAFEQNTGNISHGYNRQSMDDSRKSFNDINIDNRDGRGGNQIQSKPGNQYEPEPPKQPTTMVVFSSLPPSVNVQALNNKMREVGEVKFVDILGQGRAIVSFFNIRDSERCVKFFDGSKVDGQIIGVKFF